MAPTITSPTAGGVYATGSDITFSWIPNHPDGSAQTDCEVSIAPPSGTALALRPGAGVTSFTQRYEDAGVYSVRVRTKGLHADWGAWSNRVSFRVAVPPAIVITQPASDITAIPFLVEWSVADATGVSSQLVEIVENGVVQHSETVSPSLFSTLISPSEYLPENGTNVGIRVTVRGGSTLTSTVSVLRTVKYTPPAPPVVTITPDEAYAAHVTVKAGELNTTQDVEIPLANGGAETGTTSGWNVVYRTSDSDPKEGTCEARTEYARTGKYSMAVTVPDGATTTTVNAGSFASQYGEKYRVSAWVYTDYPYTGKFRIGLYAAALPTERVTIEEGAWTHLTAEITNENTTDVNSVVIETDLPRSTYVFYVDDVTVTQLGVPVTPPETESMIVQRILPDGSMMTIGSGLKDGQQCVDVLPPLNVGYQYRVTAYASSGATSSVLVDTTMGADYGILNFGVDAGQYLRFAYDMTVSHSRSHQTSEFHFARGDGSDAFPSSYELNQTDGQISATGMWEWDQEWYLKMLSLAEEYAYAWYREPSGLRAYVKAEQSVSVDVKENKDIQYSVDMTRLAWEEPVR